MKRPCGTQMSRISTGRRPAGLRRDLRCALAHVRARWSHSHGHDLTPSEDFMALSSPSDFTCAQFDVFDAVVMMMCQVKCSELRDYWSPKSFTFNSHIAELFTYDRFCALLRNLHFANRMAREDGGDHSPAGRETGRPKVAQLESGKSACVVLCAASLAVLTLTCTHRARCRWSSCSTRHGRQQRTTHR